MSEKICVSTVIATSHLVPAYGGIRLELQALESLAQELQVGNVPMHINHDPFRPLNVRVIDAGVRLRSDGEYEVWADLLVDKEQWKVFDSERSLYGVPGGMSISFALDLEYFPGPIDAPEDFEVLITADAFHFDSSEVKEAAREVSKAFNTRARELLQFSSVPPAKIVIEFLGSGASQVLWGVFGSLIYDVLKRLRKTRKASIEIVYRNQTQPLRATISGDIDTESLSRALEPFEEIATSTTSSFNFDTDNGRVPIETDERDAEN